MQFLLKILVSLLLFVEGDAKILKGFSIIIETFSNEISFSNSCHLHSTLKALHLLCMA